MSRSLQRVTFLENRYNNLFQSDAFLPPMLLAPSHISVKQKRSANGHARHGGLRRLTDDESLKHLYVYYACTSSYLTMSFQLLPSILLSIRNVTTFVGLAMSVQKAGTFIFSAMAPKLLTTYGFLLTSYIIIISNLAGLLLMLLAFQFSLPELVLCAMFLQGAANVISLVLQTFIQVVVERSERGKSFVKMELYAMFGALLGPVLTTLCKTENVQNIVLHGVPAIAVILVLAYSASQFGINEKAFCKLRLSPSPLHSSARLKLPRFSWVEWAFIAGSILPLVGSTIFSTLMSITFKQTYGLNPDKLIGITMPFVVSSILTLIALPLCMKFFQFSTILMSALCATCVGIAGMLPLHPHAPFSRAVFAASIIPLNGKVMVVLPLTVLSVSVSSDRFAQTIMWTKLVDGIVGVVTPVSVAFVYSLAPLGLINAPSVVFTYLFVDFLHGLVWLTYMKYEESARSRT